MDKLWAQQHNKYEYSFYNSKGEKCQNPHCGAYGIKNVFVLIHNMSGERVHVGEQCYGRWRAALGLPVGLKHQQYLEMLKKYTFELDGRRPSPAELVRIKREHEDKWLKREAKEGKLAPKDIPLYWDKVLRMKSRRAWCQKQVKEGKLELEKFYQPRGSFSTVDAAVEWAEEHGGYVVGVRTWQGRSCWLMYIKPYSSTYIPEILVFEPPTLQISHQEILQAMETGFLDGLLSEYTGEEREQVRLGLSSWVDEKLQESGLELTEKSKVNLINIMALIMRKVSKMLHNSES